MPPEIPAWNLALRFILEIAALIGLYVASLHLVSGNLRWIVAVIPPVIAIAAWGYFNVVGDPSRSGEATIAVAGWVRLAIEFTVLFGAAGALAFTGRYPFAVILAAIIIFHYAMSFDRVLWLLKQ